MVAFISSTEFWSNFIRKVMASSWVKLANCSSALEAKIGAMCSALKRMSLCSASASAGIVRISKSSSSCSSLLCLNSGELLLLSLLLFLLFRLIKDSNSI